MKLTLVGSRYFGATALERLLKEDIEIARVIVPASDDRLGVAAKAAGLDVVALDDPSIVPPEAIAEGTDLIVAAHSHARVSSEALARSRLGGIGFHPSLLPRHRGIAAVEWTIQEGDPIAGGSIYHLAEQMDAGAIAAQDWCFVRRGETARELWERALAPMGLDLLVRVIREAKTTGKLPAKPQDEQFATRAPMSRKTEGAMMRIDAIDHFVLTVASIEETCAFYERVLGMTTVSFGDGRKAVAFGSQKINLHLAGREHTPRAQHPVPGSADFCFITSLPLDTCIAHVREQGVQILLGPVDRTGATGKLRSFYFRDPDLNLVEVANCVTAVPA